MKELLCTLLTYDFKKIFYDETNNIWVQFFRYIFVGGIAFVVDWGSLILFKSGMEINLYLAVAFSFVLGLAANFVLSKIFIFKEKSKRTNLIGEFVFYTIIGVVGLLLTEAIMWILCQKLYMLYMIAKIIAAAIVLIWNFIARKIILY